MKKTILYIAMTSCLFANETLVIEKNKIFEKVVVSKTMQATFSLSGKNKHQNILEHSIKMVSDIAKKGGCYGGEYRVRPNYIYDKNIQIMDGYSTYVNFKCEFSDNKLYEKVLDNIKKVDTLTLSQGEIKYFLSDKKKESTIENLELKALDYGTKYSKMLDENLEEYKNCMIAKLSFREETFHNPTNLRMMKSTQQSDESTIVTTPIDNKKSVSLRGNYTFKCEKK